MRYYLEDRGRVLFYDYRPAIRTLSVEQIFYVAHTVDDSLHDPGNVLLIVK